MIAACYQVFNDFNDKQH